MTTAMHPGYKRFAPLTDGQVASLFLRGASLQYIATRGRQSTEEVDKRLRALRLPPDARRFAARPEEYDDLADRLREWYDNGVRLGILMAATGFKYGQVVTLLEHAGATFRTDAERGAARGMPPGSTGRRGRPGRKCPLSPSELRRRYVDDEESPQEIGRALGVSGEIVKRWLTEANIPLRGRLEAAHARDRRRRRTSPR
ncbi:hypothetical protein [Streptomyces sp. URMC 129]|uniref:hypothetical protein n=1 Tax=Streptomyces sp. URMC 129 TaxID=3423407 RepID=UPI003F1A86FF